MYQIIKLETLPPQMGYFFVLFRELRLRLLGKHTNSLVDFLEKTPLCQYLWMLNIFFSFLGFEQVAMFFPFLTTPIHYFSRKVFVSKVTCLNLIAIHVHRTVFKWLSKEISWLRLLRLVIGLKDSRQYFNQWDAKPKPIAPCTRDFFPRFERVTGDC